MIGHSILLIDDHLVLIDCLCSAICTSWNFLIQYVAKIFLFLLQRVSVPCPENHEGYGKRDINCYSKCPRFVFHFLGSHNWMLEVQCSFINCQECRRKLYLS